MLLTYVDDLSSYSAENVGYGLDAIAAVPRGEHEPVIPDTATILEAVTGAIRARRPSEPTSAEKWDEYVKRYQADREANQPDPEMAARIAKLNARLSL